MSGKLDQSLDQIMQDGKPAGAARRGGRIGRRPARSAKSKAKAAIAAPTGGVQKKNTRAPAPSAGAALTAPSTGDSKIIVSNLPEDVTETLIKDYFGKTISRVKYVNLTYGPTGKSRGIATIVFADPAAGPKAARDLDGVKVDNRAMKIEVVLGAKHAPAPPVPKTLADRMSQPKGVAAKDKPKSAAAKTNGATATNGAGKGKPGRARKAGRAGRPKKKTAEELDAEMQDYFGDSGAANGAAPAVAAPAAGNADAGMVDEVL